MPKIENAIITEFKKNGKLMAYEIYPKDGYKLHAKTRDEIKLDEYGNETGEIIKGYTFGVVTVLPDYDFRGNPQEIYAVEVEEDETDITN